MISISLVIIQTMPCWVPLISMSQNLNYSNCFCRISFCAWVRLSSIWILTSWIQLMESTSFALTFLIVSTRLLCAILDFCLTLVFPPLWWDWAKALFVVGCVFLSIVGWLLSFATSCLLLSIVGCVLFVVHYGKGICPTLLGVCNGCVVC
jgi:hypothetical protein